MSLAAVVDGTPRFTTSQGGPAQLQGLLIDQWNETVPGAEETAGLALHFDSPGARPPQALLMAMTREDSEWSLDELAAILLQTIENAQLRAVGPEALGELGHHLPAIFAPDVLKVGTRQREEDDES